MRKPHLHVLTAAWSSLAWGWGQQGQPEEEAPTCFVQVLSSPGLLPPRAAHPDFEGLERWASIRNWRNTILSEARGPGAPAGREPTPLPQTPGQQKGGYSKGTLSWDGEGALE